MNINTILYFPGFEEPASRLASELSCKTDKISVHRFPDGESLVRVPPDLSGNVLVYLSLDHPDSRLVPLGFAASAARQSGVSRVILVAPYLCYMRQDKAFHRGEAVSQRIVGAWLSDWFDNVVTVDAHLHRISTIREVIPCGVNITAAPYMAEFLKKRGGNPILLGPDEESLQWVSQIARAAGLEYGVGKKKRHGDRDVIVTLPDIDVKGREVIIVDDVLSSGMTVARAAVACRKQGASSVFCMVTHALFAGRAEKVLEEAGVESVISSDTIIHHTNRIFMASGLARAVKEIAES